MTSENNELELHKKQLFDFQFVCEIVAAAIILFLTEERHEDGDSLDEDEVVNFVLEKFPIIVDSITDDSDKAADADAGRS
jgi:hypothetical protein